MISFQKREFGYKEKLKGTQKNIPCEYTNVRADRQLDMNRKGTGPMAGNYTSHEQGDPWAKKSKNMQTERKPNILS